MRGFTTTVSIMTVIALAVACGDRSTMTDPGTTYDSGASYAKAPGGVRQGFGFNTTVSGFPTGAVFLTGGGSFDPATASNTVPSETQVVSAGGFRCTTGVAQGPLSGCATGEGVRWDTVQLLASTTFKCTGADLAKIAETGEHTAVLQADFYRAGDGIDESFTAQMIVADFDIARDVDGTQNVWVQGVGCGTAVVNFSN